MIAVNITKEESDGGNKMGKILYGDDGEPSGYVCDNCGETFDEPNKYENIYGQPICQDCKDYGDQQAANEKRYGAYL